MITFLFQTDKELNLFQTTNKSVQCISSTSAGMTKMLCCGCADKIIYVLDAISGILFTMLQGHMSTPLCIEVWLSYFHYIHEQQ